MKILISNLDRGMRKVPKNERIETFCFNPFTIHEVGGGTKPIYGNMLTFNILYRFSFAICTTNVEHLIIKWFI